MNTAGTASSSVPNPVMKAATTARAINPSATRYLTALFALEQIQSSVPRSCSDVSPIRSLWNQFLFTIGPPFPNRMKTVVGTATLQWQLPVLLS